MSDSALPAFHRPAYDTLLTRLREPRRYVQIVSGPRQVGKTTLVRQVAEDLEVSSHMATADDPGLRDRTWLAAQWEVGRRLARSASGAVLILDEIQKIGGWSETVKRLWAEDGVAGIDLKVVLLGSAPLLMQQGLNETLAGRFEVIRLGHWSLAEMQEAFGWDLETFLFYGGYPGAVPLSGDLQRWRAYILDSLIETAIARDILLLTRVDKPALLRQLFRLGCDYSAQVVSYQKLVGQLQDAGNTTTIAHYLDLLRQVGLLAGLEKYSGSKVRQRGSSPKLLALDTALVTAMSSHSLASARADADFWGRLVETAVGAHLFNTSAPGLDVTWWRDRNREVDFVVSAADEAVAIEVSSGRRKASLPGLEAFGTRVPHARPLLVGAQGLPLAQALSMPARAYLGSGPAVHG